MYSHMPPAALIAGDGALPGEVARRMAGAGIDVIVYSFTPDDGGRFPHLPEDKILSLPDLPGAEGSLSLQAFAADLAARGIKRAGMAGLIPKTAIYSAALDGSLRGLLTGGENDDHALLGRIAAALETIGIAVYNYADYIGDSLTSKGVIAGRVFNEVEKQDISYGKKILSATLPLSFGQAVVIARGAVVAIEAMEGTDRMVRRAGDLLKGAAGVLVKMMRADQDSRYDIPTVGPHTLREMAKAGLTALALEAGRVIIVDREEFLPLAEELSIAVEGILP